VKAGNILPANDLGINSISSDASDPFFHFSTFAASQIRLFDVV
jgi:hypothetical protein